MDVILWVLTYAPLFLLIISAVITVHELGHYWVGRLFGAAVESFAIGFGKPIWEKRDGRGTRWRINWLPLGGFVKFVGEMQLPQDVGAQTPETVETEAQARRIAETLPKPKAARDGVETTFYDNQILVGRPYTVLNPWQRIAVSLGGPFANFIFAILAFGVLGFVHGIPQAQEVYVTDVISGGAAEKAGFQTGDVVIEAGGRKVTTRADVIMTTQLSSGEEVNYSIKRGDAVMSLVATPVEKEVTDEALRMKQKVGQIGLGLAQRDTSIRSLNPIEAVGYGVQRTGRRHRPDVQRPAPPRHRQGRHRKAVRPARYPPPDGWRHRNDHGPEGYQSGRKARRPVLDAVPAGGHAVRGGGILQPAADARSGRWGGRHDPGRGCDRKASTGEGSERRTDNRTCVFGRLCAGYHLPGRPAAAWGELSF